MIDIEASLECELDGQALSVRASQGLIVINVQSAKTARALVRHFRRFGKIRSTVDRLNAALIASSHRLEMHIDEVTVVEMGRGTESGFLRVAGLQHLKIWPLRLLR
ncbi:MAG: hypothetical protein CBB71_06330 [Rhodopirellula sp. TMED11]|nr:MAG: hypothetical protein CBB71_06330 [Rhodopirellula sp. TMED11]